METFSKEGSELRSTKKTEWFKNMGSPKEILVKTEETIGYIPWL
jgi:hypothetical protein